jgi:hypothetical protein
MHCQEHSERNPVASAPSSQILVTLASIFYSCRPRQLKQVTIGGVGSSSYNPSSACDRIEVRSNPWLTR